MNQIPRKRNVIIQRYLSNPYLINGRKFDLRIYVYVSSYDPLCIYIYDNGLVRFASSKWVIFDCLLSTSSPSIAKLCYTTMYLGTNVFQCFILNIPWCGRIMCKRFTFSFVLVTNEIVNTENGLVVTKDLYKTIS